MTSYKLKKHDDAILLHQTLRQCPIKKMYVSTLPHQIISLSLGAYGWPIEVSTITYDDYILFDFTTAESSKSFAVENGCLSRKLKELYLIYTTEDIELEQKIIVRVEQ